jgi:hypothetical protein
MVQPDANGDFPIINAAAIKDLIYPAVTTMDPSGMHYIAGQLGTRSYSGASSVNMEPGKWLRITTGNNLSIANTKIGDVTIEYEFTGTSIGTQGGGVVNGLIGSSYDVGTNNFANRDSTFGVISGNDFNDISITMRNTQQWSYNYLAGGGVLGLRSTSSDTIIQGIVGNIFHNLTVQTTNPTYPTYAPYIEGGGIIGLDAVSSPTNARGDALIGDLSDNIFSAITVRSGDFLMGGGVIGVNNNSTNNTEYTSAKINTISGNIFGSGTFNAVNGGIVVSSHYALRGGGVIGVNGLSNADTAISTISNNFFGGIQIQPGTYLRGGGIIGLQTNDDGDDVSENPITNPGCVSGSCAVGGTIWTTSDNVFYNIIVEAGMMHNGGESGYDGGDIIGGGIIGVRTNKGSANMFAVERNVFKGIEITTHTNTGTNVNQHGDLLGGGIIGVSSQVSALIGTVASNYFDDIRQNLAGAILGGGIIGVDISSASGPTGTVAMVEFINANYFTGIQTTVDGIVGGGTIGARITTNNILSARGTVGSLSITDNFFGKDTDPLIVISTSDPITGGGVIGFAALGQNNDAIVLDINNNAFRYIQVTTVAGGDDRQIQGGGIVGLYALDGVSYIGELSNSLFDHNTVSAGAYIDGGGLVGVTGSAMTNNTIYAGISYVLENTFTNNTVTALNGQIMGGAIYSYGLVNEMVIENSVFENNEFYSTVQSSFYSGAPPAARVYGTVTIDTGQPNPNPTMSYNQVVLRGSGGRSTRFEGNEIYEGGALRTTNSIYFGNVLNVYTSAGYIYTSNDDPPASDAKLVIDAQSGSKVELYDPIEVDQRDQSGVSYAHRTFEMEVLGGGGEFIWGGINYLRVGEYDDYTHNVENVINLRPGSVTTLERAMGVYSYEYDDTGFTTETTGAGHTFNLQSGATLNIQGWDVLYAEQATELFMGSVNLNGTLNFLVDPGAVNDETHYLLGLNPNSLAPATIDGAIVTMSDFATDPGLSGGDMYYLIDSGDDNQITGEQSNSNYVVRAGSFKQYDFIIDKQAEPATLSTNRFLVARLVNIAPAKTTKIILEGVNAGLAYMAHTGGWLADHSFQQADLAIREENAWNFFAGFDVSRFWVDSYGDIDITGYTWLAGFSNKTTHAVGSLLIGAFLEGSYSSYDITGDFATIARPEVDGHGHIRYAGVGVMARQRFDNNLRIEGAIRGGQLRNHFQSNNYITNGVNVGYDLETNYYAAHLGLGYETALTDVTSLDFIVRGYWARQVGKDLALNTGEVVLLDDANSYRARGGARLTHAVTPNFSVYGGAYYEHEFDNKTSATADNYIFEDPELTGGVGIFEIGAIGHANSNDRLSVEFGLQGYAGHFKGLSGGVRVGYDF